MGFRIQGAGCGVRGLPHLAGCCASQVKVRKLPDDHRCYEHVKRPPDAPPQCGVFTEARHPTPHPTFETTPLKQPVLSISLQRRPLLFLEDSDISGRLRL